MLPLFEQLRQELSEELVQPIEYPLVNESDLLEAFKNFQTTMDRVISDLPVHETPKLCKSALASLPSWYTQKNTQQFQFTETLPVFYSPKFKLVKPRAIEQP